MHPTCETASVELKFRSSTGTMLTKEAELDWMVIHHSQIYEAPRFATNDEPLQCMPFDQAALADALRNLPELKTAAPTAPPTALWKSVADEVAPWLFNVLEKLWIRSPCLTIPEHWKASWMSMVPKRAAKSPEDLRPIALTDPLGKGVLGLISSLARDESMPQLCQIPQFAFLPYRGTTDALDQIFAFCDQIRQLSRTATPNAWDRQKGHRSPKLRGGLILSLDLSHAFDTVSRCDIACALDRLAIDTNLSKLLLGWLTNTVCHVQHAGFEKTFESKRGMRQGCKASPFLWAAWSFHFLACLDEMAGRNWTKDILLMYADDLLGKWVIETMQDFSTICSHINLLFDLLEAMNMTVNLAKCAVILNLTGSRASELRKKFVKLTHAGAVFVVPRADGRMLEIPLKKQHVYLGAIITFGNFELLNMQHRIKIGKQAFDKLRVWLTGRRGFPIHLRIQIWKCCILPCYHYSIGSSGVTIPSLLAYHRALSLNLRAILHSPVHIYRVRTSDLFRDAGLLQPVIELRRTLLTIFTKKQYKVSTLLPDDILHAFNRQTHHQQVLSVFDRFLESNPNTPATFPEISMWQCEACQQSFPTRAALRQHVTKIHQAVVPVTDFCMRRDALDGLPQCSHCMQKFVRFRTLHQHIMHRRCHTFLPTRKPAMMYVEQSHIYEQLQQGKTICLLDDNNLLAELSVRCSACGQRCATNNALAHHLTIQHSALYEQAAPILAQLTAHVSASIRDFCTTCQFAKPAKHKASQCPVLKNLALLQTITNQPQLSKEPEGGTQRAAPALALPSVDSVGDEAIAVLDADDLHAELFVACPTSFVVGQSIAYASHSGQVTHINAYSLVAQFEKPVRALPETGPAIVEASSLDVPLSIHFDDANRAFWQKVLTYMTNDDPLNWSRFMSKTDSQFRGNSSCCLCLLSCDTPILLFEHLRSYHSNIFTSITCLAEMQFRCVPGCPHCAFSTAQTRACIFLIQVRLCLVQFYHGLGARPRDGGRCGRATSASLETFSSSYHTCHGTSEQAWQNGTFPFQVGASFAPSQFEPRFDSPHTSSSTDGASTRRRPLSKPFTRFLHGLHELWRGRVYQRHAQEVAAVARCSEKEADLFTIAPGPVPPFDGGTYSPIPTRPKGPANRFHLDGLDSSRHSHPGWSLAFPDLGSGPKEDDQSILQRANHHDSHGRELEKDLNPHSGRGLRAPIPFPGWEGATGPEDRALETPNQPSALFSAHRCADDSRKQCRVDVDSKSLPPRYHAPKQPSSTGAEAAESESLNEYLRQAVLLVRIANPSQDCFANSSVLAFLWGCLVRHNFKRSNWGTGAEVFCKLLMTNKPTPLRSFPSFSDILRSVNNNLAESHPQDVAEFTTLMLNMTQPTIVTMAWERRVAVTNSNRGIEVEEFGSPLQPLGLTLPIRRKEVALQDLIDAWSQQHEMIAALCCAAHDLRAHRKALENEWSLDQEPVSTEKPHSTVAVPIFDGSTLTRYHGDYTVMSLVFHTGSINAGHYQACLRVPANKNWYITQDNIVAQTTDFLPPKIMSSIALLWLVRSDCVPHFAIPAQLPPQWRQLANFLLYQRISS